MIEAAPLPPLEPGCRMTVTIPARNEERHIAPALEALARQPEVASFDVLLFPHHCTDATVPRALEVARAYPDLRLHIVAESLPAESDHVGGVRKALMDRAALRFLRAGKPWGIIATTDADTVVASDWAARTFEAMRCVDAVAGYVGIGPAERAAMTPELRRLYATENAFRLAWAELEALLDPLPEDPWPRHCSFVAASFAVQARTYVVAGGLPAVAALEDRSFLEALRLVDARVRHSLLVRATTSGRTRPRVAGGFGTLVAHLHRQARRGEPFLVEHPRQIVAQLELRAALRALWQRRDDEQARAAVTRSLRLPPRAWLPLVERTSTFGRVYACLAKLAAERGGPYALVPVDEALSALRAAAASRKALAATRSIAASGAG